MNVFSSRGVAPRLLVRVALLVILIALWLPMAREPVIASESEPTIAELLRQYAQSLACYRQFRGEWKSVCSREIQQGAPGQYYQMPVDDVKETRFSKIWRDNERERVMAVVDRGKGKERATEAVCVRNRKWLRFRQTAVSGRIKPLASDFADTLSLATPEMCFGTIFGEELPTFVAPLTLSLRSEIKDGSPYYVISGQPTDRSFDIELWFDSTHGNALAKAKYTSHSAYDPGQERSERQLSFEWTVSRFQETDGVFVPSDVTWRMFVPSYEIEGPKGKGDIRLPPVIDVIHSSLVSIEFSPKLSDADLEPSIRVADGTPVYMMDARHLRFEWREGKIVPVGVDAMKTARDSQFLGGPGSLRSWLTINVVVVVALVLWFVVRRWRKARARAEAIEGFNRGNEPREA